MELSQILDPAKLADPVVVAILGCTISYAAYYFISVAPKIRDRYIKDHGEEEGQARHVIFQRLVGAACMGITAILAAILLPAHSLKSLGMIPEFDGRTLAAAGILGGIAILVNFFIAGRPKALEQYPQIRSSLWTQKLLLNSSLSWALYLLGYELLFRGLLLFACVWYMDPAYAIVINLALYSLAHIPKGQAETFGAIPFGIIVCGVSLWTGSFFVAFVVHVCLALSNQFFAFRAHPKMKLEG